MIKNSSPSTKTLVIELDVTQSTLVEAMIFQPTRRLGSIDYGMTSIFHISQINPTDAVHQPRTLPEYVADTRHISRLAEGIIACSLFGVKT